jgi:hypothetical protein
MNQNDLSLSVLLVNIIQIVMSELVESTGTMYKFWSYAQIIFPNSFAIQGSQ